MIEPKYLERISKSALDPWTQHLEAALRTAKDLFEQIRAMHYGGSYPHQRLAL